MKRQGLADFAVAVDELADLSIRVARDVDQRGIVFRRFVEPVDRRDGEKLAQRPMIEQRLEDGKIAEELVAERILQVVDFLRGRFRAEVMAHDAFGDLPKKRFHLRLGGQIEQPEIEAGLRVVPDLHRVVEMLAPILPV